MKYISLNWMLALKFSIGKKKRMRDCRILMAHDCTFKSLFYSSIKKTYRNNFLDREKYSLKQSFNFKKRGGESHVLLHTILVELFKGKHKTAFTLG